MAIFTFSTKGSRPQDAEMVKAVKEHCEKHQLNFSGLLVKLLAEWQEQNGQTTKIQDRVSANEQREGEGNC